MAFQHLLVPLDGSRLAEAVLPTVAYLAQKLPARVILLHMIEENPPQEVHGERHLQDKEEAYAYLEKVSINALSGEYPIEHHVHTAQVSDVARSLVAHSEELDIDLIVMCTHGRGGLRGWISGSIAQQVICLGKKPVMLVFPDEKGDAPGFVCQRILVPLDGDPEHEQGLGTAIELASCCETALHLLMVIHKLSTLPGEQSASAILLPGATAAILELSQQQAKQYLAELEERSKRLGLTVTSEVERGEPAKVVLQAARRIQADLIVMGTHAKSAQEGFWAGNLTTKMTRQHQVPLLLVPVTRR